MAMTSSAVGGPPLRVLLIDDIPEIRTLVRLSLEHSRDCVVVGEGGTGREAISLAAEHQPDVVLLDIVMPEVNGIDAIPEIARVAPNTRIVVFSGDNDPELAERARSLGAVDFIQKSLPITELHPRVRAAASFAAPEPPPDTDGTRAAQVDDEQFRLLVESVSDYAIFMVDADGRVMSWNRGAEMLKGHMAEEIIGQHVRVFYAPEAQAQGHPERSLETARRSGRYEEEGWRVRKDGSRFWANVVITPLLNPDGELVGYAQVTRDNTEQHALAEERERAARTLAEANERLRKIADEKAEFVAITAHELRGPVLLMRGSAETLTDGWDRLDDPSRRRLLELLTRGGNRLHRLLEDLLVVTRAEAGRLDLTIERLQLRPVLDESVHELEARAKIDLDCDGALAVRADRGRLVQIVNNLLANAIRYGAPPVGLIAVGGGDGMIEISVVDHGPGVPEEDVSQLFTKFANVRRSS
ncbi:MAG: response regulator, partial [Candidatus Dormibacteraeota bacterium]|nr:response regulator [Candidatus Dormibacteraeota bacterium]